MLLRRGTAGKIMKTITINWNTAGMSMRDAATSNNACTPGPALTGELNFRDSIFLKNGPSGTTHAVDHSSTVGANCSSCSIYNLWAAAPRRTSLPRTRRARPRPSPLRIPVLSLTYPNSIEAEQRGGRGERVRLQEHGLVLRDHELPRRIRSGRARTG